MRYQQDLQVRLRDRYRRLMTVDYGDLAHEIALVFGWIDGQPALRAILAEARLNEPDLDFDTWDKQVQTTQRVGTGWPSRTEEGRASLVWQLLHKIAEADSNAAELTIRGYAFALGQGNLTERARGFVQRIISPLIDFLDERIGGESNVLHILERYVRRTEWFEREELFRRFQNAPPQQGEAVYDTDLRRFLFAEGVDMPFSQARSASGESDALGELDGDDPLMCEIKLLGEGRRVRDVAKGVHQAVLYAQDYGKNTAYLVIVNLTDRPLELPSDGPAGHWPPVVELSGVRVHLIAVRARPDVTASKRGTATPLRITRDALINPETDDADGSDETPD
ncbi:MAG: hypothetical protein ACRDRL_06435 [Sciscionella sp.]